MAVLMYVHGLYQSKIHFQLLNDCTVMHVWAKIVQHIFILSPLYWLSHGHQSTYIAINSVSTIKQPAIIAYKNSSWQANVCFFMYIPVPRLTCTCTVDKHAVHTIMYPNYGHGNHIHYNISYTHIQYQWLSLLCSYTKHHSDCTASIHNACIVKYINANATA